MAKQLINTGTRADDGTGDTIREGGIKINANFDELYSYQENGFEDKADSAISADAGTRTFSLTPTGSEYSFWSGGNRYTKTAVDSLVFPDVEGNHFFYYDVTGALISTQVFTDEIITTYAFVYLLYWDADNSEIVTLAEERHGNTMDSATHLYNHNTTGTRYGSGMTVGTLDIDGSGNDATAAQFSVTGGVMWDEDIELSLGLEAAGSTNVKHLYKLGTEASPVWRTLPSNGFLVPDNGVNRATFNELLTGNWVRTEVTNIYLVLAH